MSQQPFTLGGIIRGHREKRGWTLREMAQHCGISASALSKIENDLLPLTFDRLQQLSSALNIRMSALIAQGEADDDGSARGRRSIGKIDQALRVETRNYDYYYLCTELQHKKMVPDICRIRAKSLADFGKLLRHPGEEFIYVIEGSIVVHTEFYAPVVLKKGESIYLDSNMGHAYICGDGCDEAITLGVMSTGDDMLQEVMTLLEQTTLEKAETV